MMATWFEVAAEHVWSFVAGLAIGFVGANRYRITKRPDDEK